MESLVLIGGWQLSGTKKSYLTASTSTTLINAHRPFGHCELFGPKLAGSALLWLVSIIVIIVSHKLNPQKELQISELSCLHT
jgi:hypothetical protein